MKEFIWIIWELLFRFCVLEFESWVLGLISIGLVGPPCAQNNYIWSHYRESWYIGILLQCERKWTWLRFIALVDFRRFRKSLRISHIKRFFLTYFFFFNFHVKKMSQKNDVDEKMNDLCVPEALKGTYSWCSPCSWCILKKNYESHCGSRTHLVRVEIQKSRRKYANPEYAPTYKKMYCEICDKHFKAGLGAHYKTIVHQLN